jgi:GDP-L-fucose synthase
MKTALVTGSCGFVGRHFTRRLIRDGWHVQGVDDLSSGLHPVEWDERLYGDIFPRFEQVDVREYFDYANPGEFDLIVHCAAVVGGRLKIEGDPLAVATDLAIDALFFNWCVCGPLPRKVIYFSSSAVYPVELQTPTNHCALNEAFINFDRPKIGRPDLTYGWSKLSGEYLAQIAADKYKLNVVIYRPFSGYGEDQSLDYPFPSLIQKVLNDSLVKIWGSGRQRRDFIHIDDVVEAVFATMDEMKPGEALNLGSGTGIAFIDLVDDMCRVLGRRPHVVSELGKPEGVFSRVADTARLELYYKPKVTLQEGIRRVAEHLDKAFAKA